MNDEDPIAEIRRYRQEHAAKFNYDLRKIFEDIKSREGKDGRKVVTRPPRPARMRPVETAHDQPSTDAG